MACQATKDSTAENSGEVLEDSGASKKPKDWKEFKTIFSFKSEAVSQKLGIIMLTKDSLEFRLLTDAKLCDTEYWGRAKNLYPDGDPEIDEDELNEAYEASEFTFEDSSKIIKIRIADENDKAKIKFADKTETDTDCIPSVGLLLKRVENE